VYSSVLGGRLNVHVCGEVNGIDQCEGGRGFCRGRILSVGGGLLVSILEVFKDNIKNSVRGCCVVVIKVVLVAASLWI
jgi:hypothetical protein